MPVPFLTQPPPSFLLSSSHRFSSLQLWLGSRGFLSPSGLTIRQVTLGHPLPLRPFGEGSGEQVHLAGDEGGATGSRTFYSTHPPPPHCPLHLILSYPPHHCHQLLPGPAQRTAQHGLGSHLPRPLSFSSSYTLPGPQQSAPDHYQACGTLSSSHFYVRRNLNSEAELLVSRALGGKD